MPQTGHCLRSRIAGFKPLEEGTDKELEIEAGAEAEAEDDDEDEGAESLESDEDLES